MVSIATRYAILNNGDTFTKKSKKNISAANHPRTLNLVSNSFKDIAFLLTGRTYELSNSNILEVQGNIRRE